MACATSATKAYLDDSAKFDQLVKETHPGGKVKLATIVPALKKVIDADPASANIPAETKKEFEKKYFEARAEEEMDEASYRVFLKEMMTDFVNAK